MTYIPPQLKLIAPSELFGSLQLGKSLSIKSQPTPPSKTIQTPIPDTKTLSAESVLGMSLTNITFSESPLPFDTTKEPLSLNESLGIAKSVNLKKSQNQSALREFLGQIDSHIDSNQQLRQTLSSMSQGEAFMGVLNAAKSAPLSKTQIKTIQSFLSRVAGFDLSYSGHRTGIDGGYGGKTHQALQLFFKHPAIYAARPLAKKDPQDSGTQMGVAKGTGYYPFNNAMEGGYVDKQDTPLRTLQDYLDGKVEYVSIALDKHLYRNGIIKYGDKFRIPELEAKYGQMIEFRAVDTGGAFTNKRFNRVDICTGGYRHSVEKTINGNLTLIKID